MPHFTFVFSVSRSSQRNCSYTFVYNNQGLRNGESLIKITLLREQVWLWNRPATQIEIQPIKIIASSCLFVSSTKIYS